MDTDKKPRVRHYMCHRCGEGGTLHNPLRLVMTMRLAGDHHIEQWEHSYPCLDLWGVTWEERNGLPRPKREEADNG